MARYKKTRDDAENSRWTKSRIYKLKAQQAAPLEIKIEMTKRRLEEAVYTYGLDKVAISYSGGKDSSVLSHIARQIYPDILHIFGNTKTEYSETMKLIRKQLNEFNLVVAKSKDEWTFGRVVEEFGYPMFSKDIARINRTIHRAKTEQSRENALRYLRKYQAKYEEYLNVSLADNCCEILKHGPVIKLQKKLGIECSIIGTMADESRLRTMSWVDYGCNAFTDTKNPRSRPMSFWTEKDVWEYIHQFGVEVSDLYTVHGYKRNGCMFCGFGVHLNRGWGGCNRIQRLEKTHPKAHDYLVRHFSQYFEDCGVPYKLPNGYEEFIQPNFDFAG